MDKPKINNEIMADEVRVIDDTGKNLGVLKKSAALAVAKEKGLDLIEISAKVSPPIAKIMDYGKFLYQEKRKTRGATKSAQEPELKSIRIRLATSENDLNLKAKRASEFLKGGHRLKLELFLRGREKYLDKNFLEERLKRAINLISEKYRVLQEPKKGPRGMFMILEKSK